MVIGHCTVYRTVGSFGGFLYHHFTRVPCITERASWTHMLQICKCLCAVGYVVTLKSCALGARHRADKIESRAICTRWSFLGPTSTYTSISEIRLLFLNFVRKMCGDEREYHIPCLVATDLPSDSVARLADLPNHTQICKCCAKHFTAMHKGIHKKLYSLLRKMFHVRDVSLSAVTCHCTLFRSWSVCMQFCCSYSAAF